MGKVSLASCLTSMDSVVSTHTNIDIFSCSVKSNLINLETIRTVIPSPIYLLQ